MRKLLFFFAAISTFVNINYAQRFTALPSGLRNVDDSAKAYVIINIPRNTAVQLYEKSIKYINSVYKSPVDVIKGKVDGELINFHTHIDGFFRYNNSGVKIPINADYIIQLNFKDEKVKYEIVELQMSNNKNYPVLFQGNPFSAFVLYNKKRELFKESAKEDIEVYFNNELARFIDFMLKDKEDNW